MPYRANPLYKGAAFRANPINDWVEAVADFDRIDVVPPMTISRSGGGIVLGLDEPERFFARLSNPTSPYAFSEVKGYGTGWATLPGGRSGVAREFNAIAGLAGKVVEVMRDPATAEYRFRFVRSGTPSNPDIPISGCFCTAIPQHLTMTVTPDHFDSNMFNTGTISWQPVPAGYAALAIGTDAWLGNEDWVDVNGDTFRYHLSCLVASFRLSRIYLTSIFGSPFRDPNRWSWGIGNGGNVCSPYYLDTGAIYTGGPAGCSIIVAPVP